MAFKFRRLRDELGFLAPLCLIVRDGTRTGRLPIFTPTRMRYFSRMFVMFCKSFLKKRLKLDLGKFSHARSERHMCSSGMLGIEIGSFNRVPMLLEMFSSRFPNTMKAEIGAGFTSIGLVGCSLWVFLLTYATLMIFFLTIYCKATASQPFIRNNRYAVQNYKEQRKATYRGRLGKGGYPRG